MLSPASTAGQGRHSRGTDCSGAGSHLPTSQSSADIFLKKKTRAALSLSERIWPSEWLKEIAAFLSAWGDFVNECFCARPLLCGCRLLLSFVILIIFFKKKRAEKRLLKVTTQFQCQWLCLMRSHKHTEGCPLTAPLVSRTRPESISLGPLELQICYCRSCSILPLSIPKKS